MTSSREIVITGLGVVSPIGIGRGPFWDSLCEGRSGVRSLGLFNGDDPPSPLAAEVADFDPKQYVRPRKSLKVMSRDIQLGFAAADMAYQEAALSPGAVAPERIGVIFGADMITADLSELQPAFAGCLVDGRFDFSRWGQAAMTGMFPLWMLKYLPNMPACHIAIAQDARGPNNSITLDGAASLAAIAEGARIIQRGQADVILAGGASSRIQPTIWAYGRAYQMSNRLDDPASAVRPFDADRDGLVFGEGAASVVLESREHAEARGSKILARIGGFAASYEPQPPGHTLDGRAIRQAISRVLEHSGLAAGDIGHVNAHGLSTLRDDQLEAQAIRDTLGQTPVTAPKSYFGNLSAGSGAVELIVSLLAFAHGKVPPTLNYHKPDPDCPINVIHGEPMPLGKPTALVLNHSKHFQSMALLLLAP